MSAVGYLLPLFHWEEDPEVCQHSTVMSFEMDRVGSQLIPPLPSVEARRSGVPERETNSNSRSLQSALHASILRSTSNGGGGGVGIVIITCQLCVPASRPFSPYRTHPYELSTISLFRNPPFRQATADLAVDPRWEKPKLRAAGRT